MSSGLRITAEPFWNIAISENGPRFSGLLPAKTGDLCGVDIIDGGGDTFDCYTLEDDVQITVLNRGTLLSGAWIHSASELNNPRGDTFEAYTPEDDVQTTDLNGGQAFSGSWIHSKGISEAGEDTFEDYTDGVYATDTMSEGSGFTGNWISE